MQRFMPQMSSVCACASWWNGQLCSTVTPSSTRLGFEATLPELFEEPTRRVVTPAGGGLLLCLGRDAAVPSLARRLLDGDSSIGMPSRRDRSRRVSEQPARRARSRAAEGSRASSDWRPPVHLGGSTRAGAAAVVEPAVVDLQQTVVGEPIEVVGGDAALQPERFGGLLAAHPVAPLDDIVVERSPIRFAQCTDGVQRIAAIVVLRRALVPPAVGVGLGEPTLSSIHT